MRSLVGFLQYFNFQASDAFLNINNLHIHNSLEKHLRFV